MSSPKDYIVHMIGHGHIDPTWLWRWTEGFEEVRATFRSALDRMRETPDFRFTASSACFYEWVRQSEPEMFAEIQERVREGRWEIAGGMWIEPDCNIPHGEAFVRQGLYAQRFFARHFGVQVRVGFNPDSFGHTGMLPQILRKLGMAYYAYQRPMPVFEMDYPDGTTFLWEAPDGSRVLTSNIIESYNGNLETGERLRKWPRDPHLTPGQRDLLCFYGVGNHGGGPTKAAIAQIVEAQADPEAPRVEFSTLQRYFETQEAALPSPPVIRQELQHHARGCYSAHAGIKRMNRRTEHALMTAERLAVAARLAVGQSYPHETLEGAWKDLLYNQFHDILAGTSLESSYHDAFDQMGRARHTAHEVTNLAVQRMARCIDTTPEGNTVVVFNSLPWPVRVPVTVSPVLARELKQPLELVVSDGGHIPLQRVRGESITVEAVAQSRYAFVADLPALGYRCFHARAAESHTGSPNPIQAGPTHLENQWWRIEFDPQSGQVVRLYDKSHQREVLRRGGILACLLDNSDTWSHDVKEYRLGAGQFERARMSLVEQGPVLATLQSISTFGRSTALAEWTLHHDSPEIDLSLRVDWREAYALLKIAFETALENITATAETAYGSAVRPAKGEEEPCQQWVDLSGDIDGLPYGFALLNDGQYSYDVLGGTLRLTLMRSPAYAHHDPARIDLAAQPAIMDQGWHSLRLRLVPHEGGWAEAQIPRLAWAHNVPPIAHVESAHPGDLPSQASFLHVNGDAILGPVVKQAEEGDDLVIRAYDAAGSGGEATLHVSSLNTPITLSFAPHEIKTIRVNAELGAFTECNLLEDS